jgi:hypothetical protein
MNIDRNTVSRSMEAGVSVRAAPASAKGRDTGVCRRWIGSLVAAAPVDKQKLSRALDGQPASLGEAG